MNNIFFFFSIAISLGALIFIFSEDAPLHEIQEIKPSMYTANKKIATSSISIDYIEEKELINKKEVQEIIKKENDIIQKVKIGKKVQYVTKDVKKKYKISLIDESMPITSGKSTISFSGKIDNSIFVIKIPKSIINNDLKLEIKDLKTSRIKTVSLPFVSEMIPGSLPVSVSINYQDIENIEVNYPPTYKTSPIPGLKIN